MRPVRFSVSSLMSGARMFLQPADVQALPFGDASFDAAVATSVFYPEPDPVAGLNKKIHLPCQNLVPRRRTALIVTAGKNRQAAAVEAVLVRRSSMGQIICRRGRARFVLREPWNPGGHLNNRNRAGKADVLARTR